MYYTFQGYKEYLSTCKILLCDVHNYNVYYNHNIYKYKCGYKINRKRTLLHGIIIIIYSTIVTDKYIL